MKSFDPEQTARRILDYYLSLDRLGKVKEYLEDDGREYGIEAMRLIHYNLSLGPRSEINVGALLIQSTPRAWVGARPVATVPTLKPLRKAIALVLAGADLLDQDSCCDCGRGCDHRGDVRAMRREAEGLAAQYNLCFRRRGGLAA